MAVAIVCLGRVLFFSSFARAKLLLLLLLPTTTGDYDSLLYSASPPLSPLTLVIWNTSPHGQAKVKARSSSFHSMSSISISS